MALQKTVVTPQGFSAENAYHRVENVVLIDKENIRFNVRSYKSTELPFFADQCLTCKYDMDGKNPIKQAYEYVKFLPEFDGAKDC